MGRKTTRTQSSSQSPIPANLKSRNYPAQYRGVLKTERGGEEGLLSVRLILYHLHLVLQRRRKFSQLLYSLESCQAGFIFSEGIKCKVVSLEDGHLRGFLRAGGLALIGITQRCVISRAHAWHKPPSQGNVKSIPGIGVGNSIFGGAGNGAGPAAGHLRPGAEGSRCVRIRCPAGSTCSPCTGHPCSPSPGAAPGSAR